MAVHRSALLIRNMLHLEVSPKTCNSDLSKQKGCSQTNEHKKADQSKYHAALCDHGKKRIHTSMLSNTVVSKLLLFLETGTHC